MAEKPSYSYSLAPQQASPMGGQTFQFASPAAKVPKLKDSDVITGSQVDEDFYQTGIQEEPQENWKFKFKQGSIVQESEIGVRNNTLSMFEVTKFFIWAFWLNFSRFNFIYLIYELLIFSIIGKYYIPTGYVIFVILSYFVLISVEAAFFYYFYLKVKKMERTWDDFSVHRIKDGSAVWNKVRCSDIKVGDLILLRHGTVSPADILIIDTSDTHFSEQILSTNERRVTGSNKMTIKRAVKNMRAKSTVKNSHEAIKNILPILEGQLEYEPPSQRSINFSGTFKLNNDPQISKFTHRNVLFCGTKLHTSWMMGIVLYTGKDTKIIQKNMLEWSMMKRIRAETKVSKANSFINWILIVYMVTGLLIAVLVLMQVNFEVSRDLISDVVERFYIGDSNKFMKVLMILHGSTVNVPHLMVLIYEICCFIFGIRIQSHKHNKQEELIKQAEDSISETKIYGGRRNAKKKSTKLTGDSSLNNQGWKKPKLHEESTIGQIDRNSAAIRSGDNAGMKVGSGHPGRRKTSKDYPTGSHSSESTPRKSGIPRMGTMGTIKPAVKDKDDEEDQQIKVINYEALPNLGCINHVVFDKTDTLTKETVHVCQIATCDKIYEIEGESNLKDLMVNFTKHPQEFEFEEDEEEKRAKENSFYSEKSQEYLKEIRGEFHFQVHSDNDTDMGINMSAPAFDTILRGGNTEKEGSLDSENYSMGSKLKSLSVHINTLEVADSNQRLQLPKLNLLTSASPNTPSVMIKDPSPSHAKVGEFKGSVQAKENDFNFDGDDSFLQLEMLEMQFKKAQKAQKLKILEEKKKEKLEKENKEKERLKKEKLRQEKAESGSKLDLNNLNGSQDEEDSKQNESDEDMEDKMSQENSKDSKDAANEDENITKMYKAPQVRFKMEKILTEKHLVADIRNRSESLEELLTNLFLLHLMEYGTYMSDEKYLRPEDEAIHEVIVSLGFNQTKTAKALLNQHAQYEKGKALNGGINGSSQNSKQKADSGKSSMKSMNHQTSEQRYKISSSNNFGGRQPNQRHPLIHTVYSYEIETLGGLKVQTKVFAMNIFSQNRKRKSIITNTFNGSDSQPYQLVAVGSDKSMRHVLTRSLNRKAHNQLSMLFAKIKQRGLKMMIVAKKGLTESEVQNYTKEYGKISNSARDQIDDLEKLASMMEVDMEFVGCIALRENIREDASHLIKELEKANIPISIMSGDELENCLTVVEKLKISQVNIKDSSTFYGIRSRTERGVIQEMRRIFDDVYDMLQNQNYLYMDKMLKMEKEELKKQDTIEDESRRAEVAIPQPTEEQQSLEEGLANSNANQENLQASPAEIVHQLKKPLLIPGDSTEVIMRSKTLAYHLRSVISISSSVIGYDLNPDHKAFLIEQMKKCGLTVMAIGDGFNDIGMLTCADIGIQISSHIVPLVFGDIVVPDLEHVIPLLFEHGFKINKNLLIGFLLLLNVISFTFIYPIFAMQSTLYTLMVTNVQFSVLMLYMPALPILAFTIVNQPYTVELLQKLPALYQENSIFNRNMPKVLSIFFVLGMIEGVASGLTMVFFTNYELTKDGYPSSLTTDINYLTYMFSLSVTTKSVLFLSQKNFRTVSMMAIPALLWLLVVLVINLVPAFGDIVSSSGYNLFSTGITSGVIIYLFTNFSVAGLLAEYQRTYFHRGTDLLQKFLKSEEIIQDANSQMMKYLNNYDMEEQNVFLKLIRGIKRPFKDLAAMDMSLRKIINIDFYNSNMGLSKFINLIVDEDERKKFGLFFSKSINKNRLRIFLAAFTFMIAIVYILVLLFKNSAFGGAFDSILPYCIICLVLIFIIQEWKPKYTFKILKLGILAAVIISWCLLLITDEKKLTSYTNIVKRGFTSIYMPISIGTLGMLSLAFEISSLISWLMGWKNLNFNETDGLSTDNLMYLRKISSAIVIFCLRMIFLRKNDQIQKISFLNRLRIINETSQAYDRMQMLMPDFVIERLNNFEISKNFLTDDAGEISVVFCDICEFDDVIQECGESVVEIMDEVFRNFDGFCKLHGIQKIETVGKTYMAAGGLKFIESANDFKDKHFIIRTVSLAKQMMEFTRKYTYRPGKHLKTKIGIHYGSCIFGVLGYHKPQFSLIGDTINTTSRVCTTGNSGNIILSREAYSKVQEVESGNKKNSKKKVIKDKESKQGDKLEFIKQVVYMKGKGDVKVFIIDENPGIRQKQKKEINKSIIPTPVSPNNPSLNALPAANPRASKGLGLRLEVRSGSLNEANPASSFLSPIKVSQGQMEKVFLRKTSLDVEEVEKDSPKKIDEGYSPSSLLIQAESPIKNVTGLFISQPNGLIRKGTVQVESNEGITGLAKSQGSFLAKLSIGNGGDFGEPFSPALHHMIKQNTKSRPVTATIIPQAPAPDVSLELAAAGLFTNIQPRPHAARENKSLADNLRQLMPSDINESNGDLKKLSANDSEAFPISSRFGRLSYGGAESPRHRMTIANIKIPTKEEEADEDNNQIKAIALKIPKEKSESPELEAEDSSESVPIEDNSPRVNKYTSFGFGPEHELQEQAAKHTLAKAEERHNSPPKLEVNRGRVISYGGLGKQSTRRNAEGTLILNSRSQYGEIQEHFQSQKSSLRADEGLFAQSTIRHPSVESDEEQNSEGSAHKSDDEDDVEDLVGEENRYIGTQDNSENQLLKNEYTKKNIVRHSGVADICLGINIIDIVAYETISFFDSRILSGSSLYRISHYLIAMALVVVIAMQVSRGNQRIYKGLIYLLFGLRMIIDLLELHLNTSEVVGISIDQVIRMKWIFRRSMSETLYLAACGLYYPIETLIVNLIYLLIILINSLVLFPISSSLPELTEFFFFLLFNFFDTVGSHKYQYESFCKVMAASKMSIQYVKFVNRLLPKHIQQSSSLMSRSETYKDVTILFADIVGFTAYSAGKAGRQVVEMLSRLFTEFDKECNRMNLFKLYTIGDCYVVMGFLDKYNRKNSAEEANDVVQLGISMISIIQKVRKMIKFEQLNMRIGIHTGSKVYGGLIGTDIVRFDLYGPDLVIANKMESGGMEGQINISERTKALLEELQTTNYTFEENKKIYVKSYDCEIQSYFVRYQE